MDYRNVLKEYFRDYRGPGFSMKFWDGQVFHCGRGNANAFTLLIEDSETLKRIITHGSLGFGEAYMEGKVRIEGDLEAYLRLRHTYKGSRPSRSLALRAVLASLRSPQTRRSQIAYHYDIGNHFFQMILGPESMSYSGGKYETGSESLAEAQERKLELISSWLDLSRDAMVLDLGSGWGNFAFHASRRHGWNVTGLTRSNAQLAYCLQWIKSRHLEERVHVRNQDMIADMPKREFDGITMIESVEHVGKKHLPRFFRNARSRLKPGGPLVVQSTGRYHSRPLDRWTRKYVFPGGYLPSKEELLSAVQGAGLHLEEFQDDTSDYIHTMEAWIRNLERHRIPLESEFGKPFYRLWELWMHGAKVGFQNGAMNLFRMRLRQPG